MTSETVSEAPAPSKANDSLRRFTVDAYAMTIGSITSAGAGLIAATLAARLLPAEDVGIANSGLIPAMMLLSFAAQLDLGNALHRYLPVAGRHAKRLMLISYSITGVVAVLFGCLFVAFYPDATTLFGDDKTYAFVWYSAAVLSWTLFSMLDHMLICLGKAVYVPVKNTVFGLSRIPLLFAFVGLGAYGIFASMLVPTVVLFVILTVVVAKRVYPAFVQQKPSEDYEGDFGSVARFAAASYPGALALALMAQIIPLLVLRHLGQEMSGYFAIAWLITTNLDLVATNFGVSLVVQGASNPSQIPSLMRASLRRQIFLVGPAIVFFLVLAGPILSIFGSAYANSASDLLRLLALSLVPRVLVSVYVPLLRIQRRLRLVLAIQLGMGALILSFSYLGLRIGGLNGVGAGYLAAQTTAALLMAWPLWRAFRTFRAPSSPEEAIMGSGPVTSA